jgi:uncharacterized protein (DUF1697 family)
MTPEESERQRRKIQQQLDEALEDSFPASDPVSIVTSQEEEDWGGPAPAADPEPERANETTAQSAPASTRPG